MRNTEHDLEIEAQRYLESLPDRELEAMMQDQSESAHYHLGCMVIIAGERVRRRAAKGNGSVFVDNTSTAQN